MLKIGILVLRETALTISYSTETISPVESEIVSHSPWYNGINRDYTI